MITDLAVFHQPAFWLLGISAVILIGLAKGGFIGIGMLGTPLLALALPPVQAAAILLPLLLVQDAVGAWSFRRTWDPHVLKVMLPGSVLGIGFGYVFAASLPDRWISASLGLISIGVGVQRLWAGRGGRIAPAHLLPDWVGVLCGIGMGLSSQIAHAGGPPYQLWVFPRQLARDVLAGTTIMTFAAMNWLKVPAYAALGAFTADNLLAAAALLPVALASTFAGTWLVRRTNPEAFYTLVYLLSVLVGVKLIWDAFA